MSCTDSRHALTVHQNFVQVQLLSADWNFQTWSPLNRERLDLKVIQREVYNWLHPKASCMQVIDLQFFESNPERSSSGGKNPLLVQSLGSRSTTPVISHNFHSIPGHFMRLWTTYSQDSNSIGFRRTKHPSGSSFIMVNFYFLTFSFFSFSAIKL